MKNRTIRIFCALTALLMLGVFMSSCFDGLPEETTAPDYRPIDTAEVIDLVGDVDLTADQEPGEISNDLRLSMASLALDLLRTSRDSYEGDGQLVSPLSVMLALAMTAGGAGGNTLSQMEDVLGGRLDIDELDQQLYSYVASLSSTDDAKINLANSVWVSNSDSFEVNQHFLYNVKYYYGADVFAADLASPGAVGSINNWVKDETFGMIDRILEDNSLDPDSVMVLLNALAFDAVWENQVGDLECFDDRFKGKDKSSTVRFMHTSADGYIEGKNCAGILKNYKGGKYAFLALLPNEGIDIDGYIASLDSETFLELFDGRTKAASNVKISARMPHFSFDCFIDLQDVLCELGMTDAFNSELADFSAIGRSQLGNIRIDKALHKTHITLDNSGTRAAAVTAITMVPESAPANMKYYSIDLDRPFVYAIVDTENGLPIFLGVCDNIAE